jgi:hypothetical protein
MLSKMKMPDASKPEQSDELDLALEGEMESAEEEAPSEQPSELAKFSDEELLAEYEKRGLGGPSFEAEGPSDDLGDEEMNSSNESNSKYI